MRKTIAPLPIVCLLAGYLLLLAGCGIFGSNPSAPSRVEQAIFTTVTNTITQVVPVYQTNVITKTQIIPITVTNIENQVFTTSYTNVTQMTNVTSALQTNTSLAYTLTPSDTTKATIQAAGTGINALAPGVGTIASTAVTLLVGLWGYLRSTKLKDTSVALSQETETVGEFIKALPNGATYWKAVTDFLAAHQADANVAKTVTGLLANDVSNPDAKVAAQQVINAINALQGTVQAPVAAVAPAPIAAIAPVSLTTPVKA